MMRKKKVLQKQEVGTALDPPRNWRVTMCNDDQTPRNFVFYVLKRVFGYSGEKASELIESIQKEGTGVVGVYPKSIAEAKKSEVLDNAKIFNYPLCVNTEVDDVK